MKFFCCALVVCALSMAAQAGVVPVAINSPTLYSAAYGPGIAIDNSHSIVIQHPSIPTTVNHLYRSPLIVPVGLNTDGTYVIHTPSINLEQTPLEINNEKIKDSINSSVPSVVIHGSVVPAGLPINYSPLIVPAPIVVPTDATYVAKNLGVEHISPLPGHSISTTSLNLEPAPGSK